MKKIVNFLFLFTLSVSTVFGQVNSTPSKEVLNKIEILKNANLQLSDVQIGRITTVLMGEEQNELRIKKAMEGNKSQLDIRLQEHKQHVISNIKGAMTPFQVELFEKQQLESKL